MNKRGTKFYRKNEAEVMEALGLKPTKNSGAGWIEKEDGQNDFVICQLKSTDAQSIKVNQKDLRILEANAGVCHKYPVFAIQFLNTNEVWLMVRPDELTEVANYIKTGRTERPSSIFTEVVEPEELYAQQEAKVVASSESARNAFHTNRQKRFDKTKSAT